MSEEYIFPHQCEECGSENIVVRVLYDKKIVRYFCPDCGNSRSIPKASNLRRRTNTTLSHWAQQVIKNHPFCAICGSKENLEAHHIIPVAHCERTKFTPTNGIALCRDCHYLAHHKEATHDRH